MSIVFQQIYTVQDVLTLLGSRDGESLYDWSEYGKPSVMYYPDSNSLCVAGEYLYNYKPKELFKILEEQGWKGKRKYVTVNNIEHTFDYIHCDFYPKIIINDRIELSEKAYMLKLFNAIDEDFVKYNTDEEGNWKTDD
jgi:hypothetical protein